MEKKEEKDLSTIYNFHLLLEKGNLHTRLKYSMAS